MNTDGWEIVKEGTWLYAGEITCRILLLKHGWMYGSGDYEDPEELREDHEGEFYYVQYCSPPIPNESKSTCGGFTELEKAIEFAHNGSNGTVSWNDESNS